ncbi:hypothetical protein Amal_03364 [Acetobacter malorum]|uniref:Uncharacterized protein n=1 Tax=Acetobacter malorum TaxID=178901 RepID=A0A177G866_9PROT|nr:hypothetical protein Amal_03364 [Acetobacter malorum]
MCCSFVETEFLFYFKIEVWGVASSHARIQVMTSASMTK